MDDETMDGAAAAFGKLGPALTNAQVEELDRREEEEAEQPQEPLDEHQETSDDSRADEGEQLETADEQDGEPEAPAIDPPVSWDAEAKALFATLPPEVQHKLATRESERDKFVNAKAMEAAQHRKAADAVTAQYTQLHRQYAEQLDTYAQAFEPQRPDYGLLATDPQGFAQQLAAYEQGVAQRNHLAQQSEQARQHAAAIDQQAAAQRQAAEDAQLSQEIPEWNDPTKRTEILTDIVAAARELGYDDDLIRAASPQDILAVRKAASWKQDAEKWRSLQKAKMEPVRAAKTAPKVSTPGTAQPKGSVRTQGLQDSMTRLRKSGDVRDAAAAFRNLR